MLESLFPSLAVMLAAVQLILIGRGTGLLEPPRLPAACPSCGRSGRGRDGCSCADR